MGAALQSLSIMGARGVGLSTTLDRQNRIIRAFSVQQPEMTRTAGALLPSNTTKSRFAIILLWLAAVCSFTKICGVSVIKPRYLRLKVQQMHRSRPYLYHQKSAPRCPSRNAISNECGIPRSTINSALLPIQISRRRFRPKSLKHSLSRLHLHSG